MTELLAFELVVSLIFFALSIAVAVMSKLLPTGLAPVFWVSAGAFPFILSIILALLSIWWAFDTVARMKEEKKLNLEKKPWLDELIGDRTQKIHFVVICVAVLIYVFALIPLCGGLTREYGFVIASFVFLCVTIKFFNDYLHHFPGLICFHNMFQYYFHRVILLTIKIFTSCLIPKYIYVWNIW